MKLFKIKPVHRGYNEYLTEAEWELLPRKMQEWYESVDNVYQSDDVIDEVASNLALRGKEPDEFRLNIKEDENE